LPGNKTTTYTYDELDRVSRVDYPDASSVTYTYDANGNRLTMTDSTGTTSYTYDALDRMASKTDPLGKTVSYSYDGIGNIVALGYPGGQTVKYKYDKGERLVSLTDWLGKTTAYQLNKAGQVSAALFGNKSRADMAYDAAGRQTSLINRKAGGSMISSHAMTLDANGNITNTSVQLPLQPSLPNVNRSFTYDNANRLESYNSSAVSHDDAGRIIGLDGATYSYNDRDQITSITGSLSASHAYNGDGHRVKRTISGQTTRFVIDPNRGLPEVLAETSDSGTVLRNYVYGYGLVEQIDSAKTARYYHFDPTGSTLALTNAAGAVTDSYAYTPYGETTVSGSTVNPFRYVGKLGVMDDGNGMQYMRARYYRPDVARFMSLDALAGAVDKPQSL
jgi:RHS repeat-associated protein